MSAAHDRDLAAEPEDMVQLFIERSKAGNVDGLANVYEPGALLAMPDRGRLAGEQPFGSPASNR
jgi:hypothetical protein